MTISGSGEVADKKDNRTLFNGDSKINEFFVQNFTETRNLSDFFESTNLEPTTFAQNDFQSRDFEAKPSDSKIFQTLTAENLFESTNSETTTFRSIEPTSVVTMFSLITSTFFRSTSNRGTIFDSKEEKTSFVESNTESTRFFTLTATPIPLTELGQIRSIFETGSSKFALPSGDSVSTLEDHFDLRQCPCSTKKLNRNEFKST